MSKQLVYVYGVWCCVAVLSIAAFTTFSIRHVYSESEHLKMVFLNVGQGDAIFIETPSGKQILIDGGPNRSVLRELSAHMPTLDRSLDIVIATHPDADHIGGLSDVFERYRVDFVLTPGVESQTKSSTAFTAGIETTEAEEIVVQKEMVINFHDGVLLEVLFPDQDASFFEKNVASIVVRVVFGETAFMLSGDAPKGVEEYLVSQYKTLIKSNVLKVGHHGSKTSTSDVFVEVINPEHAVISAGRDNRYGHPHTEVIDVLERFSVSVRETKNGSILFLSNGISIEVET